MTSYEKGKSFEQEVAKIVRRIADKGAKRNPGSHANWNRNSDVFTDLPCHLECKDHETLKPKEWMRQAKASSANRVPVVAFRTDGDITAMLPFESLMHLYKEIGDLREEVSDLKSPVKSLSKAILAHSDQQEGTHVSLKLPKITDGNLEREVKICRNGHICSPGRDVCQQKGCQYSSFYKKPKSKQ